MSGVTTVAGAAGGLGRLALSAGLAVALLFASGCTSEKPQIDDDPLPGEPDAPDPIFPGVVSQGCDWALIYDPARPGGNSAFPDKGARYWIAIVSGGVPAGSKLRVNGQYPDARYSSLQIYDGYLATLDSLSDFQIVPDPGNSNPFLDQTRPSGSDHGGDYTARAHIGVNRPAMPEQNAMYRPPALLGGHVARRTALAYRTYLPEGGNQGRVALPRLTLETPDGELPLANAADATVCAQIAANLRQDGARLPGSANALDPLPPAARPVFRRFDGALGTGTGGQGVGFNRDNGFMYAKTGSGYAPLLLVRARAPSYTTQPAAGTVPQVRYWSICEASFNTQMVSSCVTDRGAALDDAGYYTVVVSASQDRPSILDSVPGYAWLERNPDRVGVVTMRELLAHPTFAQATVNVDLTHPAPQVKGEYQPLATYCSAAVFSEAAAQGPAAAFEACQASRQLLP